MIIVDANILAYFFLEGVKTTAARRVRDVDADWVAPGLWRHEFANILVSACRFSKLPTGEARRIWTLAEDLMRGREYAVDMTAVLTTAEEGGVTAYDAEYVLLARTLGVPCVTEDRALQQAFPREARSMALFLDEGGTPLLARETGGGVYRSLKDGRPRVSATGSSVKTRRPRV